MYEIFLIACQIGIALSAGYIAYLTIVEPTAKAIRTKDSDAETVD